MTTLNLPITKYMAEELGWKLSIVCDNQELWEAYKLTEDSAYELFKTVPHAGGELPLTEKMVEVIYGEMSDYYPQFVERVRKFISVYFDNTPVDVLSPVVYREVHTRNVKYKYNDGGREEAGRKGDTGDCVTRAVAIAAGLPYNEVYDRLANGNKNQRASKHSRKHKSSFKKKSASNGIYTTRKWFKDYMISLGFKWVATMGIGTGCQVHLRTDELPSTGKLILSLSRHFAAYVDGVLYDTYDCSREGTRCVYGYWIKE